MSVGGVGGGGGSGGWGAGEWGGKEQGVRDAAEWWLKTGGACVLAIGLAMAGVLGGCHGGGMNADAGSSGSRAAPIARDGWSIAIHGGAGTIDPGENRELEAAYRAALAAALEEGSRRLAAGESSLDAVEAAVRVLEDNELFNAGRGAALTSRGEAELDASIMDGATLRNGAVAGVKTVRNPVSLARAVMERTRHVLIAGAGADEFGASVAASAGAGGSGSAGAGGAGAGRAIQIVPNGYFVTPRRQRMLEEELGKRAAEATPSADAGSPAAARFGTVGAVARDRKGNLAAATSTGGVTGKLPGRVGDAPIIGAGNFANASVAVSCTGTGEEFIRHGVARTVANRMELKGETVGVAAEALVFRTLKAGEGGLIAVDRDGRIAMPYNSGGMYRAAADSAGRREVRIWKD